MHHTPEQPRGSLIDEAIPRRGAMRLLASIAGDGDQRRLRRSRRRDSSLMQAARSQARGTLMEMPSSYPLHFCDQERQRAA